MFVSNQQMKLGKLAFAFTTVSVQLPILEIQEDGGIEHVGRTVFADMAIKNKSFMLVVKHQDIAETADVAFDVVCAPGFQPGFHTVLGLALTSDKPGFRDISESFKFHPEPVSEEQLPNTTHDQQGCAGCTGCETEAVPTLGYTDEYVETLFARIAKLENKVAKLKRQKAELNDQVEAWENEVENLSENLAAAHLRLGSARELGAVPGGASGENFTNSKTQRAMLTTLLNMAARQVMSPNQSFGNPTLSFSDAAKGLVETHRLAGFVLTDEEAYLIVQAISCFGSNFKNFLSQTHTPVPGNGFGPWPQQPQRFTLGGSPETQFQPRDRVVEFGFGFAPQKKYRF